MSGRGSVLAARTGQSVSAAAAATVQARWRSEVPCAGSGDRATPMLAIPAAVSTIRALARTMVRPAAVTRWQQPTASRPAVMIDRSVPAWPASTLTVWRTGL